MEISSNFNGLHRIHELEMKKLNATSNDFDLNMQLRTREKSETVSAANKMSCRRKRQAPLPPPPSALEVVTRTHPLALPLEQVRL